MKDWIQKSVNPANKGLLHKNLHVAAGKKIGREKLEKAAGSKNNKIRERAQWALNVAKR